MKPRARRSGGALGRNVQALVLAALALVATAANAGDEKRGKRELPHYDGRSSRTTPGDVALWVPRVLFSPVYLVSEYVIRRPLGAVITAAERAELPAALYDFFTFGRDHSAGFAPVAFIDFGFNPSVGIYFFWDDALFKGNALRIHGSAWTGGWLAGVFTDRVALGRRKSLSLNFSAIRRPDHVFYGTGPRTVKGAQSRYGEDRLDGSAGFDVRLWRSSRIETAVGIRSIHFYPGEFGGDPTIEQGAATGVFALPDGYARGYTAQYNRARVALDSRRPRPGSGSGARVELEAEHGTDVRRSPGSSWLRYGGTVGVFHDLNARGRVVSLSVAALFADPVGDAPVPFTEQVSLGGAKVMRGFRPGRLVDRSAAVVTARYRWPVWIWLDGAMEVAVGNVFGEWLQGFDPSLLRLSGALGIRTVGSPDSSFELLVGFGSETFQHGGQIDSVRVVMGTNRGF